MTAIVKVMLLPPGQPPVQLSSMTMVCTNFFFFYFFRILLNYFNPNMFNVSEGLKVPYVRMRPRTVTTLKFNILW